MKHKSSPTVTIGIPAYNEAQNIGVLLNVLLNQNRGSFKLKNIIVYSDGSSDNTVKIVKSYNKRLIKLIDIKYKRGLAYSQNYILRLCRSDILVLLNADVIPKGRDFIDTLISPIINFGIDLVAADIEELPSIFFIEKIFKVGADIKKNIVNNIDRGNNIYTSHGTARALSKRYYKKLNFKDSVGEDAYSYLFCIYNNYRYIRTKKATVWYKVPGNFHDFYLQHFRFIKSQKLMAKEFESKWVNKVYSLPKILAFRSIWSYFKVKPIETFFYLIILLIAKVKYIGIEKKIHNLWEVPLSTKNLFSNEN